MSKKILVIYYSQSGQLEEIVHNFVSPMVESGHKIEKVRVYPKNDFAFPWTSERFFEAMPESVRGIPVELESFELKEKVYDLVIFAYQPWYLSPSIPATSVLAAPAFKAVVKNTPVITLIGARNMWLNAQEKVKKALKEQEARLIGNVVLVDKNGNLISAVTILYWMLTGKKDQYLGVFPKPGVSEADIAGARRFGEVVNASLKENNWKGMQKKLIEAEALQVEPDLMFIEERAGRLFSIWAGIISKRKNRSFWLVLFKYYLLVALFVVAPLVLTVNKIFFRPFLRKKVRKKQQYYLELN